MLLVVDPIQSLWIVASQEDTRGHKKLHSRKQKDQHQKVSRRSGGAEDYRIEVGRV